MIIFVENAYIELSSNPGENYLHIKLRKYSWERYECKYFPSKSKVDGIFNPDMVTDQGKRKLRIQICWPPLKRSTFCRHLPIEKGWFRNSFLVKRPLPWGRNCRWVSKSTMFLNFFTEKQCIIYTNRRHSDRADLDRNSFLWKNSPIKINYIFIISMYG